MATTKARTARVRALERGYYGHLLRGPEEPKPHQREFEMESDPEGKFPYWVVELDKKGNPVKQVASDMDVEAWKDADESDELETEEDSEDESEEEEEEEEEKPVRRSRRSRR